MLYLLLQSCACFLANHHVLTAKIVSWIPEEQFDEQVDLAMKRWDSEVDALINMPAKTEAGRRAKTLVAYLAISMVCNSDFQEASREERLAFSALADLVELEPT